MHLFFPCHLVKSFEAILSHTLSGHCHFRRCNSANQMDRLFFLFFFWRSMQLYAWNSERSQSNCDLSVTNFFNEKKWRIHFFFTPRIPLWVSERERSSCKFSLLDSLLVLAVLFGRRQFESHAVVSDLRSIKTLLTHCCPGYFFYPNKRF